MAFRDFVVASIKCITILAFWLCLYFSAPVVFNKNHIEDSMIRDLLRCDEEFYVLRLCVCAYANWIIFGFLYLCLDYYYESTHQLSSKRIQYPQRKGLETLDWTLINNAIHLSAINTISTLIGMTFVFIPLARYRGLCDYANLVDSDDYNHYWYQLWTACKFPFILVLTDTIFYATHRLFHRVQWLYQNVHKLHHQFVHTYCLSANACHPLEQIVTNMSSILLPLIIFRVPMCSYWSALYFQIATLNACFCHSGYVFVRKLSPIPHDFHHKFVNLEFGAGGYCDKVFKTRLEHLYPEKYWFIMKPFDNKRN